MLGPAKSNTNSAVGSHLTFQYRHLDGRSCGISWSGTGATTIGGPLSLPRYSQEERRAPVWAAPQLCLSAGFGASNFIIGAREPDRPLTTPYID